MFCGTVPPEIEIALAATGAMGRRKRAVGAIAATPTTARAPYASQVPGGKRRKYQRYPQTFKEPDGSPTDSWDKWAAHLSTREFISLYKVGKTRFGWIVEDLHSRLHKDPIRQTAASGSPITVELMVAAGDFVMWPHQHCAHHSKPHSPPCPSNLVPYVGLRWLAGARDGECFKYGMCRDKWYKNKTSVVQALVAVYHAGMFNMDERLDDLEYLLATEKGFAARTKGTLRGCVGAT